MPTVNQARQITLPEKECDELGIAPGDSVAVVRHHDQLNITKKTPGAAAGILKGTKVKQHMSDRDSLASTLKDRR